MSLVDNLPGLKYKIGDIVIVRGVSPKNTPVNLTEVNRVFLTIGVRLDNGRTVRFEYESIYKIITEELNPEYFLWKI